MEKLDKVIAGLRHCGNDAYPGECQKCPYEFEKDLSCLDALCNEAVEVLEKLREENRDLRREVAAGVLRGMPNDWGEYPPEFPREGM